MSGEIEVGRLYEWHGDRGVFIVRVEHAGRGEVSAKVKPLYIKATGVEVDQRRVWVNQSRLHLWKEVPSD